MYTVVQHTGFGRGRNKQFMLGLESANADRKGIAEKIQKAGGVLFDTYMEAEDYCMTEQYPATYNGIIPRAPGSFSNVVVDGRRVYIPWTKK